MVGTTYIRYVTVKVIEYDTIMVWVGLGDNSYEVHETNKMLCREDEGGRNAVEVEFEYEGVGRVLGVNADVWMW